jgi:hypothetical protein
MKYFYSGLRFVMQYDWIIANTIATVASMVA